MLAAHVRLRRPLVHSPPWTEGAGLPPPPPPASPAGTRPWSPTSAVAGSPRPARSCWPIAVIGCPSRMKVTAPEPPRPSVVFSKQSRTAAGPLAVLPGSGRLSQSPSGPRTGETEADPVVSASSRVGVPAPPGPDPTGGVAGSVARAPVPLRLMVPTFQKNEVPQSAFLPRPQDAAA